MTSIPSDPAASAPAPVAPRRVACASGPGEVAAADSPREAAAAGGISPRQRTAAAGMPSPETGAGISSRVPAPARGRPQNPVRGGQRRAVGTPRTGTTPAVTRLAALPPWPAPPAPADVLLQVRLSLPPVSAARPRVSPAEYTRIGGRKVKTRSAHAYNPQAYEDYKRDVGWLFRLARVTRNDADDLGVYGIFHLGLDAGVADGDNLLKAAVDAGNGIAWRDDRQFTEWLARVVRGSGDPHTDLVVYVTRRRGGAA